MGLVRPGMLLASILGIALGGIGLANASHWFFLLLFLVGVAGALLAFMPSGPNGIGPGASGFRAAPDEAEAVFVPSQVASPAVLRSRLAEVDALRDDGVLSPAEHQRKRQALIDAWGMPAE